MLDTTANINVAISHHLIIQICYPYAELHPMRFCYIINFFTKLLIMTKHEIEA